MKKTVKKTMAILLLALVVGCDTVDATSSYVSSEETSSVETVSKEVSSEETSSKEEKELKDFIMEDGFLDVQAAGKEIKAGGLDDSYLFAETEGVKGYEINGGFYRVDAETLCRLADTPCRGDGSIKWIDYANWGSWSGSKEQPDHVPANLINDPLYMSMILPSERRCFLADRINASFLEPASDKWVNVLTIGALYQNGEKKLPDDAEFTICLSDVNLAMRTTKSDGWFTAVNEKVPDVKNGLYYLPWTIEQSLGSYTFPDKRVTYYDDHVEIKLKGSDLNGTTLKAISDEVREAAFHFWGDKYYFRCQGSEVLGLVSSFKIWVKEPEWAEYLAVGIGADWRDKNEAGIQAFAGYKHAVTAEPTTVMGHTIPPSKWEEVVGDESEKIQKLIGLK